MLADIEEKIQIRIEEKITGVKDVAVGKKRLALGAPSTFIAISGGTYRKIGQVSFKHEVSIFLSVEFKNLKGEEERRKGIYPIIEAIILTLTLQTLGLTIDPLLPVNLQNVTEEDDAKQGLIVFQIEFKTGYMIEAVSDEVITDLLKVGLNYYLKPGDDAVDASDTLTLQGGA